MKRLACFLIVSTLVSCKCSIPSGQVASEGDLVATFRGNVKDGDCEHLSGVPVLTHSSSSGFSAFDDERNTNQAVGLNYEHLMSGHTDGRSNKAPRSGYFPLSVSPVGSWTLTRTKESSPWSVSAEFTYDLKAPHYLDFAFNATIHDASQFGERAYALFFFASYMNNVIDPEINFKGHVAPGAPETWVKSSPNVQGIGNYIAEQAIALPFDSTDWALAINVPNVDRPRIAKPFYYGRTINNMVYIIMFDKLYSSEDEIRFAVARWKLPDDPRPAWDWAYVAKDVVDGKKVSFCGRVVWKQWVSREDCEQEYERWTKR